MEAQNSVCCRDGERKGKVILPSKRRNLLYIANSFQNAGISISTFISQFREVYQQLRRLQTYYLIDTEYIIWFYKVSDIVCWKY
jgi:hypothetical protein